MLAGSRCAGGEERTSEDALRLMTEIRRVGWAAYGDVDIEFEIMLEKENICMKVVILAERRLFRYILWSEMRVWLSDGGEASVDGEIHHDLNEIVVTLREEGSLEFLA